MGVICCMATLTLNGACLCETGLGSPIWKTARTPALLIHANVRPAGTIHSMVDSTRSLRTAPGMSWRPTTRTSSFASSALTAPRWVIKLGTDPLHDLMMLAIAPFDTSACRCCKGQWLAHSASSYRSPNQSSLCVHTRPLLVKTNNHPDCHGVPSVWMPKGQL